MADQAKEPLPEEDEDDKNDNYEFLGKAPKNQDTRTTFYHPPLPKPAKKFEAEEKQENELLRQFQVMISNIEVTNETKDMLNPFIRFIIGGSYYIEIKNKGPNEVYDKFGSKGIVHTTDVLRCLEPGDCRFCQRTIKTFYLASYFQLEQERLHIEVWNLNRFYLNRFMGYASIPLVDIIGGTIIQSVQCFAYSEGFKPAKPIATVNMKVNLGEIWDFKLDFMDWKTTSLLNQADNKKKLVSPQLIVQLQDKRAIFQQVKSETLKNTYFPSWSKLNEGQILFRGTYSELKQRELLVTLNDSSNILIPEQIGQKLIPLKDIIENSFAKTEMVIYKDAKLKNPDVDNTVTTCSIQGSVIVGALPKYRQTGEDETLTTSNQYLCVQINEANVFRDINDGGDAQAWVEVKWAGNCKKTKNFKKPFVNQILYFRIPIPPGKKKKSTEFEAFLQEELQTNPEIEIIVWADTQKMSIDNLGHSKLCLSQIADNSVKYEDREFVEPITKKKIQYQARVMTTTVKLTSSFWFNSNNQVNLSCWFQEDLPYPGVDLSRLQPKTRDFFPPEIESHIYGPLERYNIIFGQIIEQNFSVQEDYQHGDRLFDDILTHDQFTHQHLLPKFLSKITNSDQSILNFDEDGNPIRGIRTLGEIAHFVRCVPFQSRDSLGQQQIWCSPDFTLKARIGNEFDHALLMASLFRTCKYEDNDEYSKWVAQQKKERKNKKIELIEKVEAIRSKKEAAEQIQQFVNDFSETKEKILKSDNKWDLKNFTNIMKDDDAPKDTINDRVFVCQGLSSDGYERKVWVMTFNRNYDEVTFWDIKQHRHYVLKGRVLPGERKYLRAYLSPVISKEEREKIKENRDYRKQMSEAQSMAEFMKEQKEVQERTESVSERTSRNDDSDKLEDFDQIINYSDMEQSLKGENINLIGQLDALGGRQKQELKKLDYADLDVNDPSALDDKPKNKFFQAKERERIENDQKRSDKHLLPIDCFKDPHSNQRVDDKKENKELFEKEKHFRLPFGTIDLIFNHKNIWANLQNQDPARIYYHIHDQEKWLPLIVEPTWIEKHPQNPKREKKLQIYDESEVMAEFRANKKKKTEESKILDFKDAGDYMKPLTSFYDEVSLEPSLSGKELEKVEQRIYKEVEIALRQIRSSRNLNCQIKNTHQTKKTICKYLDYLEDKACLRLGQRAHRDYSSVIKQVKKLVPENFKVCIFPSFFNTTDCERIGTVLKDNLSDFILNTQKKVMFSIAIKVYNYGHKVNSVRVAVLKMFAHDFDNVNINTGLVGIKSPKRDLMQANADDGDDNQDVPPAGINKF